MTWGGLVERLVATKAMRTNPRRAGMRIYHYKHQPAEAKKNDDTAEVSPSLSPSPSPLPGVHGAVGVGGAPPPWRGAEVDPPSPNVTLVSMWLGYWGVNSSTPLQHPLASLLDGPEGDNFEDSYEPTKEELEVLLFPPLAPASRFAPLLFVISGCTEPEEVSHQVGTDVYFLRAQMRVFSADNAALRKEVIDL